MPRYIDADALLQRLPDDLPYKGSVKRVLMQAPTANVVPMPECNVCMRKKTETIEDLQMFVSESHDAIEKLMNATDKVICEAKADVAREIFEEIDILVYDYKHCYIQSIQFIAELAELKKKYTEVQHDG